MEIIPRLAERIQASVYDVERQAAKVNLFQLDYRDAGYKPGLVPPSEITRLRQKMWANRSRWS